MFEAFVPTRKIGCLLPNTVIDNHPAEFYRLVPEGVMLVMVGVGLKEFSSGDVDRVFKPLDAYLDQLMERGVDMVTQNGVPLPILMGVEKHDRMIRHMAEYTGKPATSTVLCVVQAAEDLGVRKVAIVNKWTEAMNATLGEFFSRGGVSITGEAIRALDPVAFHRIATGDHMQLAYELGRQAITANPDCDAVYIGGGSWLAEPVAAKLEADFGKSVICNQTAVIRANLKTLGIWKPIPGHSRLLATP
jgi:maleate cis-trans isomerase